MSRTWKHFLSLLLVFTMVLSLGVPGFALEEEPEAAAPAEETVEEPSGSGAGLTFEQVDNDIISERLPLANGAVEEEEPLYADEDLVRVSIVLNSPSAIDAGYAPAAAGSYRNSLKAEQQALASKISAEALDGAKLDVVWNLTLAGNMISAYVPYGSIEAIKNVIGVKDVVMEVRYYPTEDETVDPENITAAEMTGGTAAWNLGYTGAGSKIAIVDTGLDLSHLSFDGAAFQYAIDELNDTRDVPVQLMTEADVAEVWDSLNAAEFIGSYDGVYRSAKVPFAVNYVDRDLDVTHINDSQGEHGSHVAGIAAANKYIPGEDGYVNALDTVMTQGEAPDAQLLIMKVFGQGGGAYDSDYMIAIEDAITMGCDVVNLSLGSSVAGFTTNDTYVETLDKLVQYGLVWANSAGNNYSWIYQVPQVGSYGLYADDVNYHTGGSPGTYHNTLSVASVDNKGGVGYFIEASDGSLITYYESLSDKYTNGPILDIAGEYTFIMLLPNSDGGSDGDEEEQFGALGADILEGKVAIAWRGSSSFYVKANAAASNGAVATIIANNQAGTIYMDLTGYTYPAPAVTISQNDGYLLANLGELKEANGVYYIEGTLTILDELLATGVGTPTSQFQTMSAFSSWGGNGALTMKPEITAPGGNIWSVWGANNGTSSPQSAHDKYEQMSGTSMASPQVAGIVAVLKQYIRETGLMEKFPGLTERAVAQSLLMSTSMPLLDPETGYYWSILKQGSGLVDVNSAINARALIQVTGVPETAPASAAASIADGKVKIEVGEVKNGFDASFRVTNFSDEDMNLALSGEFFTQYILYGVFRSDYAMPINAGISWAVNGEPFAPASLALDFNGDGVSNSFDAQLLLQWCADENTPINRLNYADLDGDGNVDTNDAKLAFEYLNSATITLAAGESALISVSVSYDMSQYDEIYGNYIEGFLFVQEGNTSDGALGVTHSIPVYGFDGNFTDATMFDRGSRLEYMYGFGDGEEWYPYMYYAALGEDALEVETFLVKYAGESGAYYFGGNPLVDDETYMPERNALNAADTLAGVRFSQIRNAGASRFYVTDKYDRTVKGSEMEGGASYAAYYSSSAGAWQNTKATVGFNYAPKNAKEGDELTAHYQLAIEYYINEDGTVRWDDLGVGTELSIPFVIDNTAPDIVNVFRSTIAAPDPDDFETPVNGASAQPNDDGELPGEEPEPTEEPAVEEPAADTLEITVHDNQYVAAVALFTDEGDLLDVQGAVQDTIRGKEVYYSFDLKTIFANADEVYPYLLVQVYDYALNLSTYKVNFKDDLTNAVVESVTLNAHEALIVGKSSIRLSADVRPWGIDDAIEWTSSDEEIATVNENGVVTGVAEGVVTITAASCLDPTKFDTCEVMVKFVDKDLSGIIWDEEGQVWFADFNLNTMPEYTKLNADNLRLQLTSAAYDENGVLYASSFDTENWTSTLYTVNTSDWSVTAIGPESDPGFMDLCQAPSLGEDHLLAVYAYYVLIVNKTTGQYEGAFNLSSFTGGNYFVGIAYEEQYDHPSYGMTDWVFLVDEAGNLYNTGFLPYGSSYSRFGVSSLGNMGYATELPYWQSLYYDGASLYWSRFNSTDDNKVDMIFVDHLYTDGSIYNVGSFAESVWPVGGLFENGRNPYFGPIEEADHSDAVVDASAVFESTVPNLCPNYIPDEDLYEEEPIVEADPIIDVEEPVIEEPIVEEEPVVELEPVDEIQPIDDGEYTGGLDFARVELPGNAGQEKAAVEYVVNVTAEELATNGKIVIDYDPTTITLIEAIPAAQYRGIVDRTQERGHYVLAWVDLDGIPADGVILTLRFTSDSIGTVTINTYEVNELDTAADETLPHEELVYLGSVAIPETHEHSYELSKWIWAEDFSSAAAVFTCPQDGASKTVEAEIEAALAFPTCTTVVQNIYTATVVFEGETYTDTKYEDVAPMGHTYLPPVWSWTAADAATATFTCMYDDDEQVIEATVVGVTTEPTCLETGKTVYTATVVFEDETYTDENIVPIPALGHDWSDPVWVWDGVTAATATFNCSRDEGHTQTLPATITSSVAADGTVTYTATVELEGVPYTDTATGYAVICNGKTLVIGEKFANKAYFIIPDGLAADEGAYAMLNDQKVLISEAQKSKISVGYEYAFSSDIGPMTLNDYVTIKFFTGNDEPVTLLSKTGEALPDGFSFKAQDYIDSKIQQNSNAKLVELLKALSDIGHYAQVFFNHNTGNLADLYLDNTGVTAASLANYASKINSINEAVVTYNGTSMLLQNEVKIRQYFKLKSGVSIDDLVFTINGEEVTPIYKSGEYYVDSKNVPAKDFDQFYVFQIVDQEGNVVYNGEYSAFSYVYSKLNNSTDETLLNLVRTMVLYNQAAKAYFS